MIQSGQHYGIRAAEIAVTISQTEHFTNVVESASQSPRTLDDIINAHRDLSKSNIYADIRHLNEQNKELPPATEVQISAIKNIAEKEKQAREHTKSSLERPSGLVRDEKLNIASLDALLDKDRDLSQSNILSEVSEFTKQNPNHPAPTEAQINQIKEIRNQELKTQETTLNNENSLSQHHLSSIDDSNEQDKSKKAPDMSL